MTAKGIVTTALLALLFSVNAVAEPIRVLVVTGGHSFETDMIEIAGGRSGQSVLRKMPDHGRHDRAQRPEDHQPLADFSRIRSTPSSTSVMMRCKVSGFASIINPRSALRLRLIRPGIDALTA